MGDSGTALVASAPHATDLDADTLAKLVADGDCKRLTPEQRIAYYKTRCEAAGLDYRTQPFEFLTLNGKLVLYARKEAASQLAANHGIRCEIQDQRTEHDMRVVTVRAITRDGRQTDEIGVVNVAGKKGDDLANAMMKAVTKAKRRAILTVCGLGMLDETELETIPGAATPRSTGTPPPLEPIRRRVEAAAPQGVTDPTPGGAPPSASFDPATDTLPADPPSAATQAAAARAGFVGDPADQPRGKVARPITAAQVKLLWSALRSGPRSEDELRQHLRDRYGLHSTKQIAPGAQFEAIVAWAQGQD